MQAPHLLLITRNLPPMIGGMERLLWHIVDELRQHYTVYLVGPKGCKAHLPDDVRVREAPVRPLWLFFLCALFAALGQAWRCRPDIVVAGSGLTAPFAWLSARLFRARCVVYLHGFDARAAHPIYRRFWMPLFRRFDRVIVNSSFTRELALDIGVDPGRISILHPGVALPRMERATGQASAFRARHHLADAPMLLYVGRVTARKGLFVFADQMLPAIAARLPDLRVMVIGDNPTESAQKHGDECGRVRSALERHNLLDKVLFLGNCHDDEVLSGAYFAANALIFPLQRDANDVEGFGMVALEAAAHGLPTVAFAVGGVVDAVRDGVSGYLVLPGDIEAFTLAVLRFLPDNGKSPARLAGCRSFAEPFGWPAFGDKLRQIMQAIEKEEPSL